MLFDPWWSRVTLKFKLKKNNLDCKKVIVEFLFEDYNKQQFIDPYFEATENPLMLFLFMLHHFFIERKMFCFRLFVCGSGKIYFKSAGDVSGFNQHFRFSKNQLI